MVHRSSTWWRALAVGLLSLATTAWPSAARAATTPSFTLVHQDPVAVLTAGGSARVTLSLSLAHPGRRAVIQVSLYSRLITRSALEPLLSGSAPSGAATSTTGNLALTCTSRREITVNVTLFTRAPSGRSGSCAARPARLHLACSGAACNGVYPISYSVTSDGVATTEWSLLAVRAGTVARPLHLNLVYTLDPSALAHPQRARSTLRALARHANIPAAITADYRTLDAVSGLSAHVSAEWRSALDAALTSPLHRAVIAPPGDVDYGALAEVGLSGQVREQLQLSSHLLRTLTGRYVDAPVVVSGHPTAQSLAALASAGVREVVLPEPTLSTPPSTTLTWGAPFHVAGAPGLVALATDQGLAQLATNASIEPGRRAVMTLDTLAFLHYEEPNAPAVRTVVIADPAGALDPVYVNDLLAGLAHDAFVTPSSLVPSFDTALIATNSAPATQSLAPGTPSSWSAHNVASLTTLSSSISSFARAITNDARATSLRVALARVELVGAPAPRQNAINRVAATLASQLAHFRVDAGSVTLTGPGTPLPVTLFSSEHYTVAVVVHLITDRISFPNGASVPVSLDAPVKSLRVPTANHRGSSLTLQVVVTTPDGQLTLARAAVQVRIAGTSVVGYLLTGGSLLVIGVWWWRTARRRPKGRHAR
ncbi:MAG TPA: hypothetical protein VND83_01825 [Acidimicrobiales bacterium]|nr:hypothetical protein [Acidimicrobiales bacterium]